MPPRAREESPLPSNLPREANAASYTHRIPQNEESRGEITKERYGELLHDALSNTKDILARKQGNMAWYEIEEQHDLKPEERAQIQVEAKETTEDIRRLERRREYLERIEAAFAEGDIDTEWYKDELHRRDLREMVNRAFTNQEIAPEKRSREGIKLCAIAFAAYLNDELLGEYLVDDKRRYKAIIDESIDKLPETARPVIKQCLQWALGEGYLTLPPKARRGVIAEPPPIPTAAPAVLEVIWKRVVEEARTFDKDRTTALVAAKPGAGNREIKKPRDLVRRLHEGDTLEVQALRIGKPVLCLMEGISQIHTEGGLLHFRVANLMLDQETRPAAYNVTIPLDSPGSAILTPDGAARMKEPTLYLLTQHFTIKQKP